MVEDVGIVARTALDTILKPVDEDAHHVTQGEVDTARYGIVGFAVRGLVLAR